MSDEQAGPTPSPSQPLGIFGGRVDEKGRLKLPVDLQPLVSGQTLFITTLDERTGRVYTREVWERNLKILGDNTDDPEAAEDLAFMANVYGGTAEMDSQGRVLIPAELRKLLSLENQQVWLEWSRGGASIYTKEVYEERMGRARTDRASKLSAFKKKGLQ